ncbi:hypothetical protein [Paenibacillus sp. An7]|uniref:hypothetical protein n=1 Tax=Paenibacillus sp. An7 TaxID=2689577 RepID=UPI00135AEC55|nr:hypothetical protein [Paenibacillus sp. An7]
MVIVSSGERYICRVAGNNLSVLIGTLGWRETIFRCSSVPWGAGNDLSVLMLHLFWLDVSRIEEVNGPAKAKSRYDLGMILFP